MLACAVPAVESGVDAELIGDALRTACDLIEAACDALDAVNLQRKQGAA